MKRQRKSDIHLKFPQLGLSQLQPNHSPVESEVLGSSSEVDAIVMHG